MYKDFLKYSQIKLSMARFKPFWQQITLKLLGRGRGRIISSALKQHCFLFTGATRAIVHRLVYWISKIARLSRET